MHLFLRFLSAAAVFAVTAHSFLKAAPPENPPGLLVHCVTPSDTDPQIDQFSGGEWFHWTYYDPAASDKKQLLVFLPGTGGKPSGTMALCQLAAREGFRAITLAYPDTLSVSYFHASINPDAFLKARENIIYGGKPFGELATSVPNSIQSRLTHLLRYLADHFPQESWQQFLQPDGQSIDYRKLIVAGQSQGGGHAALIAYQHEVARVLTFGSPKDFNVRFNQPAKWYSSPSTTPLNRFFSFVHSQDEGHGCTYPQQLENYRAMKLSPQYPVINVDDQAPPYGHTRLLTSHFPSNFPHSAPIKAPAYRVVWKYLLEEPVE